MEKQERMLELIDIINKANLAYYSTDAEIMSNQEWDKLYEELQRLEAETGIIHSNSPTQKVGYSVASALPKEKHAVPALSLDKEKNVENLVQFMNGQELVMSWKMDGLTVVLTYEGGKLVKAVTRGNGLVGEVITDNAKMFLGLPLTIPDKTAITVRGEAHITYPDFEVINENLPENEEPYKNPRNLCSGSVRQLNPMVTKSRNVRFAAFSAVMNKVCRTRSEQFAYLNQLGFPVVEHVVIRTVEELRNQMALFTERVKSKMIPFPVDGLVFQYNDIVYGESLGCTSKFPRDSKAFKWEDDTKKTTLREIYWSPSRTGLINPVAVFDPVDLVGTTTSRASVHNVSILEGLSLTPGDTITVYKANMIIPQVAENLTRKGTPIIPAHCPACGKPTTIEFGRDGARTLCCKNPACSAKHVKAFTHAVGREALDINGLSEETLRKLMDAGLLKTLPDLFQLKEKKNEIVPLEGFGEKSYQKLVDSIEKARKTDLQRLLYALGINYVGRNASKLICKAFDYNVMAVVNATKDQLLTIPDIGDAIAESFVSWFKNQLNQELFEALYAELTLTKPTAVSNLPLNGLIFVITGGVHHYRNRAELKSKIELLGGKVSGSVSKNTNYLINNDANPVSPSKKDRDAKALGVTIISEDQFQAMIGEE